MTTRVPAEEIEVSTAEKVLAVMLAIFISVGIVWAYLRIDDIGSAMVQPTSSALAAIEANEAANGAHFRARRELRAAHNEVTRTREAYRTALDADRPAAALERDYVDAQTGQEDAERRLEVTREEVNETAPAAERAQSRLTRARHSEQTEHDRQTFLLRLSLLVIVLGSSYYLLARLRRRRSRYLPAVYAWIGASGVLVIVMAGDYTGNYVEFSEAGPLAISLAGIALTLAAFVALQRYLARRVPARRVRKGECPFCGFPIRGGHHCEGCGRPVVSECSRCQATRRVGTDHCAACGKA